MRFERSKADLGLRLVVMTAVLTVPLAFYIGANEAFNTPKGIVLVVLGLVSSLLILLRGVPLRAKSLIPGLVFLGCCLLSFLRTPLLEASVERFIELAAIGILLMAAETPAVPKRRLLALAILTHFIVTFYSSLQYLDIDFINWTGFGTKRVYSTMGNPNFLAAQTSLLFPVTLCLLFGTRNLGLRIVLGAALAFALPSLLYTQTRGAIIAFAASCAALAFLVNRFIYRLSARRFTGWVGGGAALVLIVLMLLPTGKLFVERFKEFLDPVHSPSVQTRLFYGYSGWLMGTDYCPGKEASPLAAIGTGIGAFHLAGARTQGIAMRIWEKRWPTASEQTSPHLELYAHNDYIHLFAEIGPIGLGVYLWILLCLLVGGWRALRGPPSSDLTRQWLLVGLVSTVAAFIINTAVNFVLKVPQNAHLLVACLLPALLLYSPFPARPLTLPRNRVFLFVAAAGILALCARACAKLAASNYLKTGHSNAQARVDPAKPGYAQTQRRLLEIAMSYYDLAGKLRPVHTDAILVHYYAGIAHQRTGALDEAIERYDRSIELFTHFPEGHRSRGFTKFSRAVALSPDQVEGREAGMDAALEDFRKAEALNPKDIESLMQIGYIQQGKGEDAEAVEKFTRANALMGDGAVPESNYFLAVSLVRLGRAKEALAPLELVLSRFPQSKVTPSARTLLKQLKSGVRPKL